MDVKTRLGLKNPPRRSFAVAYGALSVRRVCFVPLNKRAGAGGGYIYIFDYSVQYCIHTLGWLVAAASDKPPNMYVCR